MRRSARFSTLLLVILGLILCSCGVPDAASGPQETQPTSESSSTQSGDEAPIGVGDRVPGFLFEFPCSNLPAGWYRSLCPDVFFSHDPEGAVLFAFIDGQQNGGIELMNYFYDKGYIHRWASAGVQTCTLVHLQKAGNEGFQEIIKSRRLPAVGSIFPYASDQEDQVAALYGISARPAFALVGPGQVLTSRLQGGEDIRERLVTEMDHFLAREPAARVGTQLRRIAANLSTTGGDPKETYLPQRNETWGTYQPLCLSFVSPEQPDSLDLLRRIREELQPQLEYVDFLTVFAGSREQADATFAEDGWPERVILDEAESLAFRLLARQYPTVYLFLDGQSISWAQTGSISWDELRSETEEMNRAGGAVLTGQPCPSVDLPPLKPYGAVASIPDDWEGTRLIVFSSGST